MSPLSPTDLDLCLALAIGAGEFALAARLAPSASPKACAEAVKRMVSGEPARSKNEALLALEPLATRAQEIDAPLLLDAARGHWPEAFQILLSLSDPLARDPEGDSAAHFLLGRAHESDAEGESDPNGRQMLASLRRAHRALVDAAQLEVDLHQACRENDLAKVQALLDQGANPRAFFGDWTPSLICSRYGHLDILMELFNRDPACKDDVDCDGLGNLTLAAVIQDNDCFDFVLQHCLPDQANKDGETALCFAIQNRRWAQALALAKTSDLSLKDRWARGPMHWLARVDVYLSDLPSTHGVDTPLDGLKLDRADVAFLTNLPPLLSLFCHAPGAFDPDQHGKTPWDYLKDYEGSDDAARLISQGIERELALAERSELLDQCAPAPARPPLRM